MSTTHGIPLPGDTLDNRTVVASTWLDDSDDNYIALVLLLNATDPFYAVAEIGADENRDWHTSAEETFRNINEAVKAYAENGGGI
jgi:hypothetical protein